MTGQQHMWQPSGDLIITDDIADHTATLLEVRGNQLVVRVQGHEGTINLPDDLRLCACVPGPSVVGSGGQPTTWTPTGPTWRISPAAATCSASIPSAACQTMRR